MSRMSLEAESSSRSAWNARAAVVRCSGARVLRTPSHVKASLTAAIVVRSLCAALRSRLVVGVLMGGVVVRRELVWPVVGSVVVAVDIGMNGFLVEWMEGPAAKTACRLVAAQVGKSHWLVTVSRAYGGRSEGAPTSEKGWIAASSLRCRATGMVSHHEPGRSTCRGQNRSFCRGQCDSFKKIPLPSRAAHCLRYSAAECGNGCRHQLAFRSPDS